MVPNIRELFHELDRGIFQLEDDEMVACDIQDKIYNLSPTAFINLYSRWRKIGIVVLPADHPLNLGDR